MPKGEDTMTIGINCGHTLDGQPGSGAVGYISESKETRAVGIRLTELLNSAGYTAYDCTNDYAHTTSENLSEIVSMANSKPLDLFVSIHFNSGGGNGVEVYTNGGKSFAEAENVCSEISKLGFKNRGIKDGSGLYVIRRTNAKAMLIEVCFVDSKSDTDLYKKIGPDKIAGAIFTAITGKTSEEELTVTQYEELKNEIQALKPVVYNYMDQNMPVWARPTIQMLMDKGYLEGDDGKLGLTMDMIRMFVILDRAGVFN